MITPPTPYDSIPYPGYAYTQTHPDRLATISQLMGLPVASIDRCRVLEVGCGDGANLIPMALGLPGSQFYGFDLATQPIARAKALAETLGVTNLRFEASDIQDAAGHLGEFDYIIAHGFYSWVPLEARDQLMALCEAKLAPNGVAFVSYNTLPGGHLRRMLREMLLFHVENAPDPNTKIRQARAFLGFVGQLAKGEDEYEVFLQKELERASKYDPAYFFHDDLAPINDPCYLHEFVAHAGRFGLQFLGDLNSSFVHVGDVGPEAAAALDELKDNPVLREQYLDFARCRRFRQTLLCRGGIPLRAEPDPETVWKLLVSSSAWPESEVPDVRSPKVEEFRGDRNAVLRTGHPILKAALMALRKEWPVRMTLPILAQRIAVLLGESSVPAEIVIQSVLGAFSMRMLELHVHAPAVTNQPSATPRSSSLARWQAGQGSLLTNLNHSTVRVDDQARRGLLQILDGSLHPNELSRSLGFTSQELNDHLDALAHLALLEA